MIADDDGRTTETWVYAGIRTGSKGNRACAWIDPDGNQLLYAERAADFVIGARYEATIRREGDRCSLYGKPRFVSKAGHDDPQVAEYAVADRIAKTTLARAQMERSAARADALETTLAPIEELAASYHKTADLDALVAYVSRRIHTAYLDRTPRRK